MKISNIKKIYCNSKRYDIQTKNNHNFFANNILVHNSLIIISKYKDFLIINTPGSFESEQVLFAYHWLADHNITYSDFEKGLTYCFEAIYPENKIVLDYGNAKDLILITVIDNETGKELNIYEDVKLSVNKVNVVYGFATIDSLIEEINLDKFINQEGFVLKYLESNSRVKFKYMRYFTLHKIVSGLNDHYIWEVLSSGKNVFTEIFKKENIPDEMFQYIHDVCHNMILKKFEIEDEVETFYLEALAHSINRKEFAMKVKDYKYSACFFRKYDKRDYQDIIWKYLEPKL